MSKECNTDQQSSLNSPVPKLKRVGSLSSICKVRTPFKSPLRSPLTTPNEQTRVYKPSPLTPTYKTPSGIFTAKLK